MEFFIAETAPNGQQLKVAYLPQKVSLKRDAALATVEIAGSNNSPIQWTGGHTSASMVLGLYSEEEGRQDVLRKVAWLESLTYADGGGKVPQILLVFGNTFTGYVWMVKSVSTDLEYFNKYVQAPIQAQVSLELVLDPSDKPLYQNDIRYRV